MSKVSLSFPDISRKLKRLSLPKVDAVVGIATGGTVPASLVAHELECPLINIHINYRDENNSPRYRSPQLLETTSVPTGTQKLLLIDDVSVSGKTLALAKEVLNGYDVVTFVFKGKADIVLLPEVSTCVDWPWSINMPADFAGQHIKLTKC